MQKFTDIILQDFLKQIAESTHFYAGYPENLEFDYTSILPFFQYHLNNAGDPFIIGDFGLQSKEFEQYCIYWFAQLYQLQEYWGIVHMLTLKRLVLEKCTTATGSPSKVGISRIRVRANIQLRNLSQKLGDKKYSEIFV
jgi:hypothetical protein